MVSRMIGIENQAELEFDTDYDFKSLDQKFKEIEIAIKNNLGEVSPTLLAELYKNTVPQITKNNVTQEKCNQEIDEANFDDYPDVEKEVDLNIDTED